MTAEDIELRAEYRGEGLYIYWQNPFSDGKKEDVLMFMWPSHPVESTREVEQIYEALAALFVKAGRYKNVLEEALEYFADREDADHNGERYVPNKEMRLASQIRETLEPRGRLSQEKGAANGSRA